MTKILTKNSLFEIKIKKYCVTKGLIEGFFRKILIFYKNDKNFTKKSIFRDELILVSLRYTKKI